MNELAVYWLLLFLYLSINNNTLYKKLLVNLTHSFQYNLEI